MRQRIGTSFILGAVAACSQPEPSPQVTERVQILELAQTTAARLPAAPPCVLPALVDTSEWKRRSSTASSLHILLPPESEPDSARAAGFIHGGQAWSTGKRTIEEAYGQWSRSSFRSKPTQRECRTVLGGLPAWIQERSSAEGYSATAWVADPVEPYDPVLGVSSPDPSDRAMLLTVLQSVQWR